MKNLLLIFLFGLPAVAWSQGSIEVKVMEIREAKGDIRVGLFNNEGDFLKKAVEGKVVKASTEGVTVVFENLPEGDYAVSVLHDENGNGEMDKNVMGIPKEGFAFGNNAMGTFGPPSFEKSKVVVKKGKVQQELKMKYM
jgi:uncharacterized protein (DUF2141 family)